MITRKILPVLLRKLSPGFAVGLFGARRTGKTVLMNQVIQETAGKHLVVSGEDFDVQEILSSQKLSLLKSFTAGYTHLFIDEAQIIPRIGNNLKLIVDNIPGIALFFTGSSSFELYNQIGEPLTGRSVFLNLYGFSQQELDEDFLTARKTLDSKLIYGLYPQVSMEDQLSKKEELLQSIKNGYLLKDLLAFNMQKDSVFVLNLLRLIAFQIGNDISYSELAGRLNVNVRTVQRYLNILEKMFIVFSLPGFSKNLRNEYTKTPRYYFWDNGIRNSIISNFNPVHIRNDTGQLWENYCISERQKFLAFNRISTNTFFWRTYTQKEIDYLEEREGKLFAYELKLSVKRTIIPALFAQNYPDSVYSEINRDNFYSFITEK
ncbi:MAG: ATP-binding protein [Bacteroidales bacterium]|nr:ATP-binding protein [Bacteroidales bacterium]